MEEVGGNHACAALLGASGLYNQYGGSATDIRLVGGNWDFFDSLKTRIMVAAGGSSGSEHQVGTSGGGLQGYSGGHGTGATQTSPGGASTGGFGVAGIPTYGGNICNGNVLTGASSGYYGGGASNLGGSQTGGQSAGSGSSFISGHQGCDAITEDSTSTNIVHTNQANHYSGYFFTDTIMIDGSGYKWTTEKEDNIGMPTHDASSTMSGNVGSGFVKITYLGR